MKVLEDLFERLQALPEDSFFSYLAYSTDSTPTSMELRVTEEPVRYDTRKLTLFLVGMIVELNKVERDPAYNTAFLKNTNVKGTYLLDGVMKLSQYYRLKCITISPRTLSVSFKDPLDVQKIENIFLQSEDVLGRGITTRKETERQKKRMKISEGGLDIFSVSPYAVTFFFPSVIRSVEKGEKWIRVLGELVTRIHQDEIFSLENKVFFLGKYVPFLKLASPELFSEAIVKNLRLIGEAIREGGVPNGALQETKSSKCYRGGTLKRKFKVLPKYLGEHIAYVVFLEETGEFVVRFSLPIDMVHAEQVLKERGLTLGNEEVNRFKKKMTIRKGGGARFIESSMKTVSRKIFIEGHPFGKIEGSHILSFSLDRLDFGLSVFSLIYNNRLFVTGWVETSDAESDLSKFERLVIQNADDLVDFYDFFVRDPEDRERATRIREGEDVRINPKGSFDRVVDLFYLHGGPEKDFYQIFFAVLKDIKEKTEKYLHEFSNFEEETRKRGAAKLRKMNHMLKACEEITSRSISA